jgi:trans-2,3-dihydro-3-hydroxyanthranilate isomerase
MPPSGFHSNAPEVTGGRDRMKYPFVTLDVFTDTRFAGNSLGVVFDADSIESAKMLAVAREFGHPETVFVVKPENAGSTARARIFTPAIEMPFAGHPTVGTALALALKRKAGNAIVLEEKIGPLQCNVKIEGEAHGRASFLLPALPRALGPAAANEAIAAALGLSTDDIGFDGHQPSKWSIGPTFTFVPVSGIDAVRRCRIDDAKWDAAFEANGQSFAFVFSRETENKAHHFHARMFAPRAGVREDPATGSAAAAFSGFCAQSLSLRDGKHDFIIEQGFEMGRPSLIELGVVVRGGALASGTVGGPAVIVTEGMIEV